MHLAYNWRMTVRHVRVTSDATQLSIPEPHLAHPLLDKALECHSPTRPRVTPTRSSVKAAQRTGVWAHRATDVPSGGRRG